MSLDNNNYMGWTAFDDPENEDEAVMLNAGVEVPPVEVANPGHLQKGLEEFDPNAVLEGQAEADVVRNEFNRPEAESVDEVRIDFDQGYVQVFRGAQSPSEYVISSIGTDGKIGIVDPQGNVSTSEQAAMATPEYTAVMETIRDVYDSEEERERNRSEFGLQSPTDMYKEVMSDGEYEVPEGDAVFKGLDRTEGDNRFKGNASKATEFFDELDRIAEFMMDYEEDYNANDSLTVPDAPTRPMRAKKDTYKFRVPDTDQEVSIVVNQDYSEVNGKIEIDVEALSDHDGPTRLY